MTPEQPIHPEQPIKVLLVDDHEMVADGLAAVLGTEPDIEVVGEASNGGRVRLAEEYVLTWS